MKGLIRKDLYMIWTYGKMLLVMSGLFLVFGALVEEQKYFFLIYPVLFGGVLPVTLISYEERDGWNSLCDTMPISRRTVVNERFLMTLLCFLALYVLTLAVQAAVLLPKGRGAELGQLACTLPGVGLLAPAVMIPVTLRWGVEKGRIVYYFFIGVFVALGLIGANLLKGLDGEIAGVGMGATLAAAVAAFALAWLISIRLYEKREL